MKNYTASTSSFGNRTITSERSGPTRSAPTLSSRAIEIRAAAVDVSCTGSCSPNSTAAEGDAARLSGGEMLSRFTVRTLSVTVALTALTTPANRF